MGALCCLAICLDHADHQVKAKNYCKVLSLQLKSGHRQEQYCLSALGIYIGLINTLVNYYAYAPVHFVSYQETT